VIAWVIIYYINIGGVYAPYFSPVVANQPECERLMKSLDIGKGFTDIRGSCQKILIPK